MIIRLARAEDTAQILAIYAQYIESTATFEYDLPSYSAFAARIEAISREYPYIVCEEEGRLLGYAYARRERERAAYQWNVELSVYVDKDYRRRGIGGRLYNVLQTLLSCMGIYNAYACVTLPNAASCAFHEAQGFKRIGVHTQTGFKNGQWLDTAWYEKRLLNEPEEPLGREGLDELPNELVTGILNYFS